MCNVLFFLLSALRYDEATLAQVEQIQKEVIIIMNGAADSYNSEYYLYFRLHSLQSSLESWKIFQVFRRNMPLMIAYTKQRSR